MGTKDYLYYLSTDRQNRFRYFHDAQREQIVRFSIQYEALIDNEWTAIVRYDTAHGRPHKDILHRNGNRERIEFQGYTREAVLNVGERDLKANWHHYRATYLEEKDK